MLDKKDFLYDKRLRDRLIRTGLLGEKECADYLANLPDVADKSEPLLAEGTEEQESETSADDQA